MIIEQTEENRHYPLVSVLFITYNRIHLLEQTLRSFLAHTTYPRDRLELIVCDDASPVEIQEKIRQLPFDVFLLGTTNQGIGHNTNKGIRRASGDFILQLQDDWVMHKCCDYIEQSIAALNTHHDVVMIRYTETEGYDFQTPRNFEDFFAHIQCSKATKGPNKQLKVFSKEQSDPDMNRVIYSDHPHLKRKLCHEKIGYYAEGIKMELTELDMSTKFLNSVSTEAALLIGYEKLFTHIGEQDSFRTKTLKDHIVYFVQRLPLGKKLFSVYQKAKRKIMHPR